MKLKTLAAAALCTTMMIAAGSAYAATVTFVGGTGGNTGTVITGSPAGVNQNNLANGSSNIGFDWTNTSPAFLAFSEFSVGAAFSLIFNDYEPEGDILGAEGARSGFQLYSKIGDILTALLPQTPGASPCGTDVVTAFGSDQCVLVTGALNDPTIFVTPEQTYGLFGAGTYVLMFSEGNNPTNGSAEFLVSPVPVPAAGFLLIGALGGLAMLRRRKTV